jgi:hypothetical protein
LRGLAPGGCFARLRAAVTFGAALPAVDMTA